MTIDSNARLDHIAQPLDDFVQLLCAGDSTALGRYVAQVKSGARTRVGAANFLATFLLFVKAADVPHVLFGCDQLEDFAATTTSKPKRALETVRPTRNARQIRPITRSSQDTRRCRTAVKRTSTCSRKASWTVTIKCAARFVSLPRCCTVFPTKRRTIRICIRRLRSS